jgi:UDP-GlcNAc3NAcA epimerase
MRLLTVVGARPQFIKAAVVSRALAAAGLTEVMVHTGQHSDAGMSDIFFEELAIPRPAHHLGIHGGGHGEMTGRMMIALEAVCRREAPDWVVVYGDTNSTLAGALVAVKLQIPVAHIEAGLRSFTLRMAEEVNRIVTDRVSTLLFCPTRAAVDNLCREGRTGGVHWVGDVMYDLTLAAAAAARQTSRVLERLGLEPGSYRLATVHRAENTDDPAALAAVVGYLRQRAQTLPVVLPLHPRTRQAVARDGLDLAGLRVIEPVGFLDMHRLLGGAAEVLTDSGGVQKEACFHRVPCVTLRDQTEWVETVEAGWNRLWRQPDYRPRREVGEYGDGQAAQRIVGLLAAAGTPA